MRVTATQKTEPHGSRRSPGSHADTLIWGLELNFEVNLAALFPNYIPRICIPRRVSEAVAMFLVVVDRKGLTSATGSGNSCLVTTTVTLTDSLDIDQYCGQCISEFVAHIPLAWPLDYCPNQVSNALLARSSQIITTMFDVLPQGELCASH